MSKQQESIVCLRCGSIESIENVLRYATGAGRTAADRWEDSVGSADVSVNITKSATLHGDSEVGADGSVRKEARSWN